jgi:hypothetical protein
VDMYILLLHPIHKKIEYFLSNCGLTPHNHTHTTTTTNTTTITHPAKPSVTFASNSPEEHRVVVVVVMIVIAIVGYR